jgi:tripartite-type tricarboxylate transporter receptor subunit TctC
MRCTALASLVATCGVLGCGSRPEPQADPARFFESRTLTYVVATDPGGGYDTYGRLVAQYLGKHLKAARVLVRNVPGGGHIVGANEIFRARPDGLTLGIFSSGVIYATLLRQQALVADLTRMSWVGKAGRDVRVLVVSQRSGYWSVGDVRASGRPLLLGETGLGTSGYYESRLLTHAMQLRSRTVLGLSSREAELAMLRGDIEGSFGSAASIRPFVKNGHGRVIARLGPSEDPADGPDITPLATAPGARSVLALVEAIAKLSRWTAGPPGIPAERLDVLRRAYAAALADPELRATAARLDVPIHPMGGVDLQREVDALLRQPPDVVELLTRVASGALVAP